MRVLTGKSVLASPVATGRESTAQVTLLEKSFSSFTQAAASLERSYTQLQVQVGALRRELEETNRDLADSLKENQRTRERLDRILESLPCGVVTMAADGCVSLENPEASRLLGGMVDTGHSLQDLLSNCADQCETNIVSGQEGSISVAVRRARMRGGNCAELFIAQDISELKRLEQEHELLRRRQALAEISATLAHEIRNPLGSLELFAGLLAGQQLNQDERGWVRNLQAGLRTLSATVNNVLYFYSNPHPQLSPLDLGALIGSLAQFLKPQAEATGVTIEIDHSLDEIWVRGDRHRLEQVILNLSQNAFRFMPDGGVLKISGEGCITDQRDLVRVVVADSGPEIDPEDCERIFEPGFTSRPGSPGLGLAVARTIMEQHAGTIRAVPGDGGARFELKFPRLDLNLWQQ